MICEKARRRLEESRNNDSDLEKENREYLDCLRRNICPACGEDLWLNPTYTTTYFGSRIEKICPNHGQMDVVYK